jgi:ribulose-5-phosphate 4-epimerase/fuculose-1-phosphate aldolase
MLAVVSDADLRRDLVTANRIAHHEGLFEAFGHISARVPGSQDRFYIARRMSPALVTQDDLLGMDVRGNVVEGSGRPNMEFWIHAGIYAARPDVNVVVHAHPPYCVALANVGQTVRPLTITGTVFTEPIPVFRTFGLINTPELGQAVAACLGERRAMLLRGHGANVTGQSIQEAIVSAIYLEQEALAQWRAMAIGQPEFFTQAELDRTGPVAFDPVSFERAWDYYLARLQA